MVELYVVQIQYSFLAKSELLILARPYKLISLKNSCSTKHTCGHTILYANAQYNIPATKLTEHAPNTKHALINTMRLLTESTVN